MKPANPHAALRHHVTGAIERGDAAPVVEVPPTGRHYVAISHDEGRILYRVTDGRSDFVTVPRRDLAADIARRLNLGTLQPAEATAYALVHFNDAAPPAAPYTLTIARTVTPEQLCGWFVNLIECNGMSVSWLSHDYAATVEASPAAAARAKATAPNVVVYGDAAFYAAPDWRFVFRYDDPNGDGGEGARCARRTAAWPDVVKGLQLMAEKSPDHFADLLSDEGDENTSDVFIQYVLLGSIIYG